MPRKPPKEYLYTHGLPKADRPQSYQEWRNVVKRFQRLQAKQIKFGISQPLQSPEYEAYQYFRQQRDSALERVRQATLYVRNEETFFKESTTARLSEFAAKHPKIAEAVERYRSGDFLYEDLKDYIKTYKRSLEYTLTGGSP